MRRCRALILYAAVVAGPSFAWRFSSIDNDDVLRSLDLAEGRDKAHLVETTILFGAASALLASFSFPALPLVYIAAGYCLGAMCGGVSVLLGATCGQFGAFLLYRRFIPRRFREASAATRVVRVWMTLLRLSPVVPAPIANSVAVLFEASHAQFLPTTILGSAPLILLYESMVRQGRGLLHGVGMEWTQIVPYVAVLLVGTLLSLLGPWRSLLGAARHVKVDALAAMARNATPELANVAVAARTGD